MKVSKLIQELEQCAPDETVFIASVGYRSKTRYHIRRVDEYMGEDGGVFLIEGSQDQDYPYLPADFLD